jgi:ATP-dependent protease HslVU (ClpYQ) peptidase subunit
MIVVGGTYREECANPLTRLLRGSGLRAAAALNSSEIHATLYSAIEEAAADEAKYVAGGLEVEDSWHARTESVRFGYFTPLSAPTIDGRLSKLAGSLVADDSTVLVFGMVEASEGQIRVGSRSLILDPQQPRDLVELDMSGLACDQLAIVANAAETVALGGGNTIREAADKLRDRYKADVVVTKRAAMGCLVTTEGSQIAVGPFPTHRVWPIGSGDIFAAAFALFWGELRATPEEAARAASLWTAHWCANPDRDLRIEGDPKQHGVLVELDPGPQPNTYLAGPFFNLSQRWLVELVRESLLHLGATTFSPFHDVGRGGSDVARQDLEGLEESTSMLALLDGADAGTLFEAGYATAKRIPVVGYAENPDPEGWKMLEGTGAELHQDLTTAAYRAIWAGMGMGLRAV